MYEDGQLVQMTRGSRILDFIYDGNGVPVSVAYRSRATSTPTYYYYAVNSRGDVIALYNSNGTIAAQYEYDAYGKLLGVTTSAGVSITSETSIAIMNPLRYRGYVYDNETGLYYNSTRYYDPTICRFVNADTTEVLTATLSAHNDKNLFAYCDNNPVSRADDDGDFWNFVIGAVVGGVVGGIVAGVTSYIETGSVNWGSVLINVGVGAVSGLVAATGLGAFAQAGITAAVSGVGSAADQYVTEGKINWLEVGVNSAIGFGTSIGGSMIGSAIGKNLSSKGASLVKTGRNKLLTGVVRRCVGQSHSSMIRQGYKFVSQGMKLINTSRGISSVVGTGISASVTARYNLFYKKELRFLS